MTKTTPTLAGKIYVATIHKTNTFPRKVLIVNTDGWLMWRRADRADLVQRCCSARAWATWMKKYRAKEQADAHS